MHDINPQAPAEPGSTLPTDLPAAAPSSRVGHHPGRGEIVRDLPEWDLLPPSTVITLRRLAR
jgi:hypothetical protein